MADIAPRLACFARRVTQGLVARRSNLTEPTQNRAKSLGETAMRYTVEPDGDELAEIGKLAESGKLKPRIQATFPLEQAAQALATVERGHTAGKVVLTCG